MDELSELLTAATAALAPEYFRLPIHGVAPVYRERVYCYELYHQLRLRWSGASPYRLNGEIDKRAHPYFADGAARPSLTCWCGRNHAIFEVKSLHGQADGTLKATLPLSRLTPPHAG